MKKLSNYSLITVFTFFLTAAMANAEPYIGINLGKGNIDGYKEAASGFIYAGYDRKYFAIEAGVNPLGYYEQESIDESIQVDGFEVDLLGKLTINEKFTAYAKLGYFGYTLKPKLSGTAQSELDGNTISYGVGIMMNVGQTLRARVAYEVYDDIETLDANRIVFGLAARIF